MDTKKFFEMMTATSSARSAIEKKLGHPDFDAVTCRAIDIVGERHGVEGVYMLLYKLMERTEYAKLTTCPAWRDWIEDHPEIIGAGSEGRIPEHEFFPPRQLP